MIPLALLILGTILMLISVNLKSNVAIGEPRKVRTANGSILLLIGLTFNFIAGIWFGLTLHLPF